MGRPTQNERSSAVTGKLLVSSLWLYKMEIKNDSPPSEILLGLILAEFLAISVTMYKAL